MELQHLAEVSRNEAIVCGHRLSSCFKADGSNPVVEEPPPEPSCLATTGNANASSLVAECNAVSGGANKQCSVNVSCSDVERQIVAACEVARKTGRNYKQFCSKYPANFGLPDD